MLEIEIPEIELFDEENSSFIKKPSVVLRLEYSLSSISKWEMKWKKPFLSKLPSHEKSLEEVIDFLRIMCVDDLDPEIFSTLPPFVIERINEYIDDPMTATTFSDMDESSNSSVTTSELIYYWMAELGIPFECEHWPFQKLMTLIRVSSIKREEASGNGKKLSTNDVMARNRRLNAERKAKYKTKG